MKTIVQPNQSSNSILTFCNADIETPLKTALPVLLVETNTDDELLERRLFRQNKVSNELVVRRSHQEALAYLFSEGHRCPPAFILVEYRLPGTTGLEFVSRIRQQEKTARLPVLILTTLAGDQRTLDDVMDDRTASLMKPLTFQELLSSLRHLDVRLSFIGPEATASQTGSVYEKE